MAKRVVTIRAHGGPVPVLVRIEPNTQCTEHVLWFRFGGKETHRIPLKDGVEKKIGMLMGTQMLELYTE